ncbi:glycerophosphodiester phosphodiesterase family protein [Zoogloea sp.]|uniref:glycerophosphodiester phosphodiesterase family protein n=1 Tax=Zoogloea sp. TaxID=49181 RepID=UPI001416D368|nr:MAG: glycerophosphodiester phosphodiesterase [Zoogloea sp.]
MSACWPGPALYVHRCGGALAPENTLAGLRIAGRLGCAAVEFDVMLSADGVPVVIHDETLERTAGRPGRVSCMSAAELLAVDVGRAFHPAFQGELLPSFEAVLATCAELGLVANVEIKPAGGFEVDTGRVVGELLARRAPDVEVLLSSFSADALEAAAQRVPDLPRALLVEAYSLAAQARALELGCHGLNLGRQGLRPEHVRQARAAGLHVLVYTVNDALDARQLKAWGVTGVFSDRPDLIR